MQQRTWGHSQIANYEKPQRCKRGHVHFKDIGPHVRTIRRATITRALHNKGYNFVAHMFATTKHKEVCIHREAVYVES